MPKIPSSIKSKIKKNQEKLDPVWKGPDVDGITQSMISRYLVCPERFRILTVEGWKALEGFSKALEYGNMWHICEEFFARGESYEDELRKYAVELIRRYPLDQKEIEKWWNVCLLQFPVYVDYWKKHPDVRKRKPICQEKCFKIPYELPSGRTIHMRGKFDSVDRISRKIWLQENKTKGTVRQNELERQLGFDLQAMYYLTALIHDPEITGKIAGMRYNVIRRPLSGGKGTIRPHQATKTKEAETMDHYYDRLKEIIELDASEKDKDGNPTECTFFMRWEVEIEEHDIDRFKNLFLNPVLDNLVDDYEWWTSDSGRKQPFNYLLRSEEFPHHTRRQYLHPFGVYNVLNEGGSTDLDEYLRNGSTVGLERTKTMFPEL